MIFGTLVGRCTTKLQKQNTLEFCRLYITKRFAYCRLRFVCSIKCVVVLVFHLSRHLCFCLFCVRNGLPFQFTSHEQQLRMLIILKHWYKSVNQGYNMTQHQTRVLKTSCSIKMFAFTITRLRVGTLPLDWHPWYRRAPSLYSVTNNWTLPKVAISCGHLVTIQHGISLGRHTQTQCPRLLILICGDKCKRTCISWNTLVFRPLT